MHYQMPHFRKSLIFFILLLVIEFSSGRDALMRDTLSTGETLKNGEFLVSAKGTFTLGFFNRGMPSNSYLGITYYKRKMPLFIWVANREKPINDSSGVMSFLMPNNLVIHQSNLRVPIWSTGNLGPGKNYSAQLLDNGNFVVFEEERNGVIAWQSFDHPTNIWLPEMKLGVNRKIGLNWSLTSWKSYDDPGKGDVSLRIDVIHREFSELCLYKGSNRRWRSGPLNGARLGEISPQYFFNVTYADNEDGVYMTYSTRTPSTFSLIEVNYNDFMMMWEWNPDIQKWRMVWNLPKVSCETYNYCGSNVYCETYSETMISCECFPGFNEGGGGCVRKRDGNVCRNGEGFVKLSRMKMPDTTTARVDMKQGWKECEEECLRDCNCTAFANSTEKGIVCVMWYGNLLDTTKSESGGQDLFVRVDAIELEQIRGKRHSSSNKKLKVAAVATSVGVVSSFIAFFILRWQGLCSRAEQGPANNWTKEVFEANENNNNIQIIDLLSLAEATNNFCDENKLGKGGFGTVYKGTLKDGYVIAVKRLSQTSQQGVVEFQNEATLVSRLQHINLVKLLGCCAEQKEKILIYEYMPNKSLDSLIFDAEKSSCLNWELRFNIIMGITRGMMYLHSDSRSKIIHRDLKASNILLDAQMKPKISDFGMARFFDNDEVEAITRTVVGTYGYMSPEYIAHGTYSPKSDVYSFGVLLLEIISGKKNNTYINRETINLLDLVWCLGEHALEIVDSSMGDYDAKTAQRCIHVGLLCVQTDPDHRPTMSEIFVMLSSEETNLPTPYPPAIVHRPRRPGPSSSSDYISSSNYISSSGDYISSNQGSCNDLTCSEIVPR